MALLELVKSHWAEYMLRKFSLGVFAGWKWSYLLRLVAKQRSLTWPMFQSHFHSFLQINNEYRLLFNDYDEFLKWKGQRER